MWIELSTGLEVTEWVIRSANPLTTYPFPLPDNPDGYAKLTKTEAPSVGPFTKLLRGPNEATSEGWKTTWLQIPMSYEEMVQATSDKWQDIRDTRKGLISDSDWTQLPDSPLSTEKKAEWATYRQALRDITHEPDPFNLQWPQPPL